MRISEYLVINSKDSSEEEKEGKGGTTPFKENYYKNTKNDI